MNEWRLGRLFARKFPSPKPASGSEEWVRKQHFQLKSEFYWAVWLIAGLQPALILRWCTSALVSARNRLESRHLVRSRWEERYYSHRGYEPRHWVRSMWTMHTSLTSPDQGSIVQHASSDLPGIYSVLHVSGCEVPPPNFATIPVSLQLYANRDYFRWRQKQAINLL